jgi:hypothetical protein
MRLERKETGMANTEKVVLTVTFLNGTIQKFEYPRGPQDNPKLASNVEAVLKSPQLLLEVGGSLIVIPMSSILSVEIAPAPSKMPATAIKGVRRIS